MRFEDLPVEVRTMRVQSLGGEFQTEQASLSKGDVRVRRITPADIPNQFDLYLDKSILTVTTRRDSDAVFLSQELSIGSAFVARIGNAGADGSLELQIAFFFGELLEFGTMEIGVDEYINDRAAKLARVRGSQVSDWLQQQSIFEFGGETYLCIAAGSAVESILEDRSDEEEDSTSTLLSGRERTAAQSPTKVGPDAQTSFCITGREIRFVATLKAIPNGGEVLVATKLTSRRNERYRATRLARGSFQLVDWTKTGQVQLLAKAQLTALTTQRGSYLRKWDEFGDLEGELFLARLRRFGSLSVDEFREEQAGEVRVRIPVEKEDIAHMLSEGLIDEVKWVRDIPDYLSDLSITWPEFRKSLSQREHLTTRNKVQAATTDTEELRLEVKKYDSATRTLTLKAEAKPAPGKLILSAVGETAQIRRREDARQRIMDGTSANPEVGVLIEEGGMIRSLRNPQKVKPLTAYVREKVFSSPPTLMQQRAVEVALNTPDIALIQGPPGTGKTTVIAAILERLNEIFAEKGIVGKGEVLLTGFQHDAVENMISRLSINGLPVPKFGQRSSSNNKSRDDFDRTLDKWCLEVSSAIRSRNPAVADVESEAQIRDLAGQYLSAPSSHLALSLVRRIADIDVNILGEEISRRAFNMAREFSNSSRSVTKEDLRLTAVRALRTKPESFYDDGPERARDVLHLLRDEMVEEDIALLKEASSKQKRLREPALLRRLELLKARLLSIYVQPPEFRVEKPLERLVCLTTDALERINSYGRSTKDHKAAALLRFLNDLEDNPGLMREALASYSFAFASTVQQSVNHEMQRRKRRTDGTNDGAYSDQLIDYQYVIVDEAARVSPRDLMISMAQGKRIILVGDHRQLPHLVEREVELMMDRGDAVDDDLFWLERSMFEYLFSERLKALEEHDGIVRRVTLDRQFRMHPKLGEFISRNFYERFDPTEQFSSGLTEESFFHALPRTNGDSAIWLEVPRGYGGTERPGTSFVRKVEVEAIIDLLSEWIESPEGSGLTYGVISFYKAQADLIQKAIDRRGLNNERVMVGTVDSFQGREFDVVLLSAVRTVSTAPIQENVDVRTQSRRLFGHLCLANRLNVSMSRQRRLLVVAGDPKLVEGEVAAEAIPGLVDFYRISRKISFMESADASS